MSMIRCDHCPALIDSDDDPDCFVEVGNMRRLSETIVMCEPCRDRWREKREAEEAAADRAIDQAQRRAP